MQKGRHRRPMHDLARRTLLQRQEARQRVILAYSAYDILVIRSPSSRRGVHVETVSVIQAYGYSKARGSILHHAELLISRVTISTYIPVAKRSETACPLALASIKPTRGRREHWHKGTWQSFLLLSERRDAKRRFSVGGRRQGLLSAADTTSERLARS